MIETSLIETSLDSLDDHFREEYVEPFLAELMRVRLYVAVIETSRSKERQKFLFDAGKTKTLTKSRHLTGEAIDLAPVAYYMNGKVGRIDWNINPSWHKMGEIGLSMGLEWGGEWSSFPDYVHFQRPEDDFSYKDLFASYEPLHAA
jgi:hypothetical protein